LGTLHARLVRIRWHPGSTSVLYDLCLHITGVPYISSQQVHVLNHILQWVAFGPAMSSVARYVPLMLAAAGGPLTPGTGTLSDELCLLSNARVRHPEISGSDMVCIRHRYETSLADPQHAVTSAVSRYHRYSRRSDRGSCCISGVTCVYDRGSTPLKTLGLLHQ